MKKTGLFFSLLLIAVRSFAQNASHIVVPSAKPIPTRTVRGMVQDSAGITLIGASVILKLGHDSLTTVTNIDGEFFFNGLKKRYYTLTVHSIGYFSQITRVKIKRVQGKPEFPLIVLKPVSHCCFENLIVRPVSIVYKVDTLTYIARFYKVSRKAKLAELLKKMEGMEIAGDSSLTHQGQAVLRVKLNGQIYKGGDVAKAITIIPARGIKQIQIIDDYGESAQVTSIKDGDPIKVLNIVTKR